MSWILGVDGGGTSSRALAFDAGAAAKGDFSSPLASASGAATNPNAVGEAGFQRNLSALFEGVKGGVPTGGRALADQDLVAVCVATAGVGRPADRIMAERISRAVFGPRCGLAVAGDHEAALVGALRSEEGFILISGTGSVACARARDGRTVRSGGLGHWLGDEGSAFAVAFQALARSLRSVEGRDLETSMLNDLLHSLGLQDADAAVPFIYSRFEKSAVAAAAPVVQAARERADPLAIDIFARAADELALMVRSVRDRAPFKTQGTRVALWGGMLEKDEAFRGDVIARLRVATPELVAVRPEGSATEGACRLALGAMR